MIELFNYLMFLTIQTMLTFLAIGAGIYLSLKITAWIIEKQLDFGVHRI